MASGVIKGDHPLLQLGKEVVEGDLKQNVEDKKEAENVKDKKEIDDLVEVKLETENGANVDLNNYNTTLDCDDQEGVKFYDESYEENFNSFKQELVDIENSTVQLLKVKTVKKEGNKSKTVGHYSCRLY